MIGNEMLDKVTYRDYDHNLKVLSGIKGEIEEKYLSSANISEDDFVKNLYSSILDQDFFLSQCRSITNQINQLVNGKSLLLNQMKDILKDYDFYLVKISQELIFDIHELFNSYFGVLCPYTEGRISRPNYVVSQNFFLAAKFARFDYRGMPPCFTNRDMHISCMPTFIRQAVEIKVKEILGIITIKCDKIPFLPISKLLSFLVDNHEKYFDLPVEPKYLRYINNWTNSFIHTGIVPFFWQSLEAIDLLNDLFATEKDEYGLNLFGFKYRKSDFDIKSLKDDLEEKFKKCGCTFIMEDTE